MVSTDTQGGEQCRLAALKNYSILDTSREEEFDNITALASRLCRTSVSMITFLDETREWVKSWHGFEIQEIGRDVSFGAHVITGGDQPFIVPDASRDKRFPDNPLVAGGPGIIFYAGVPLVTTEGYALGTLCVMDSVSVSLDGSHLTYLQILAGQAVRFLEWRRRVADLEQKNHKLANFTRKAAHDLKSPLCSISMMTELFREQYGDQLEEDGVELLISINESTSLLAQNVDDILKGDLSG